MKTRIKCLLAAPILALAAVLCVAPATAGPPMSKVTNEKLMQADQHAIAPSNVENAVSLTMKDVVIATTQAEKWVTNGAATPNETATSLSDSASFGKGGAALCAEKLAVNGQSSCDLSFTGTAGTTTSPPNSAIACSTSATSNGSLDSSMSTAPSELVGSNTVCTCHVQSFAAAQNAAATELVGDTS